ncbi:MAG: DUF302 domain-containing protein [Magnetococcales bacterium]|nr:DUF302 domain-containing protein [Magnetococcales bacterium]MBF0113705.1 DUF302 domain-containing protein [Magnetococcales bacterium]
MDSVPHYAVVTVSPVAFDATVEAVKAALSAQGFGVMCEIDVSGTLKKKLDADTPRTLILGACNPQLALRALTAVPDIATLLPCNVVVRQQGERVEIAMINPLMMANLIAHPEVDAVATEADQRLRAAIDSVVG